MRASLITFATTIPLLLLSTQASAAQAGTSYAGFQYANVNYQEPGFPELNPAVLVGRVGHFLTDAVAVEGRIGFGITDDSITYSGIPISLEVDSIVGIYAVGYLPVGDSASLYGLFGFTSGEITASALGYSVSGDEDDISYGIGAELSFGGNASANIEYTSYIDKATFDASAISLGVSVGF